MKMMNKNVKAVSGDDSQVTINTSATQEAHEQQQQQQTFLLLRQTTVKYSNKRCNCKCIKTATPIDTSPKITQNSKLQLLEKQQQQQVEEVLYKQKQLLQQNESQECHNDFNIESNFKISIECCRRKKNPSTAAATTAAQTTADQSTVAQLLSTAGNCYSQNCCSSFKLHNTPSSCGGSIKVPNTTSKTLQQPKVLSIRIIKKSSCDADEQEDKHASLYFLQTAATITTKPCSSISSQERHQNLQKVSNFLKICLFLLMLLLLLLLSKATLFLATAIAFSCAFLLLQKQQQQSLQCARRNALLSFLLSSLLYAQLLSLTPQTLGNNGGDSRNIINASNFNTNSNSSNNGGGGTSSALLGLELAFGNAAPATLPHDDDDGRQKLHDVTQLMLTLDSSTGVGSSSNSLFNVKSKRAPDALLAGGGDNIVNFISRDHVLERAHTGVESIAPATAAVKATENVTPLLLNSGCQSCQMREKVKQDNLESIKNHILMRLKLSKPPNITGPIQVPHNILEDFYNKCSVNGGNGCVGGTTVRRKSSKTLTYQQRHYHASFSDTASSSGADATDIQGDDPLAYSTLAAAGTSTAERQQFLHSYGGSEMDDAWQPQLLSETDYIGGGSSSSSEKATKDQQWNFDEEPEEEEPEEDDFEEDFYSRVNSVYVFPTISRLRHNRKLEILNFQLDSEQFESSTISHAFVHVYIRGHDWMSKHLLNVPAFQAISTESKSKGGAADDVVNNDEVVIMIYQAVRRQNATNFTHTIKLSETRHKIPNGIGQWVQIEVKQLGSYWMNNRNSTHGIVVKGAEHWMRTYIANGSSASSENQVFIELLTQQGRKGRQKRSTSLDCSESDNEVRCCRYPLRVNFSNFGWNWVVAPTSFNAYFCNGECKLGFLEKHAHTHLASLSTSAQPCCSPTKMSPLRLLYFNNDNTLVVSTIPNMSVEKCSCS